MEKILVPVSSEVRLSNLDLLAQGIENVQKIQNREFLIAAAIIGTSILIALTGIFYFERKHKETKVNDL